MYPLSVVSLLVLTHGPRNGFKRFDTFGDCSEHVDTFSLPLEIKFLTVTHRMLGTVHYRV